MSVPVRHHAHGSVSTRPSSRAGHAHGSSGASLVRPPFRASASGHAASLSHSSHSASTLAQGYGHGHAYSQGHGNSIDAAAYSPSAFADAEDSPRAPKARAAFTPMPLPSGTPVSYVQAVHSFDPSALPSTSAAVKTGNMYLRFKAGEVIRVWSKDEKGWWDGEITGPNERAGVRRGWFPSNYVKEMKETFHDRNASVASIESTRRPMSRQASSASVHSGHSHTHSRSMSRQSSYAIPEHFQRVLVPVSQALRLLDDAVRDNHTSHFQPSTAHIISCIRGALERMDCLSKDSPTLTRLPLLHKERKGVLVELSRLVACARAASGVNDAEPVVEIPPGRELEALEAASKSVSAAMMRVVQLAVEYDVKLKYGSDRSGDASASTAATVPNHTSIPSHSSTTQHIQEPRRIRSPPPSNERMQSAFRRAPSASDVQIRSDAAPAMVSTRSTSSAGTTPDSASFPSNPSRRARAHTSVSSGFSHRTTSSEGLGPAFEPRHMTLDTIDDIFDAIQLAEDALYSTMAAFIGQIHGHARGAHPTAHAGLIRMTKLSVDCIKEIITVTETLGSRIQAQDDGDDWDADQEERIDRLVGAKTELYELANRLVDTADIVASGGLADAYSYEDDKQSLIDLASEGMRLAAGSAGIIRWALHPDEFTLPDKEDGVYSTPPGAYGRNSVQGHRTTPRMPPERDRVSAVRDRERERDRDDHTMTVAGLSRRVDSLGGAARWQDESEELMQNEDETVRHTTKTAPLLSTPRPGMIRSRSNSLTSPIPPRVQRNSPSRSADLDKLTSDYPDLANLQIKQQQQQEETDDTIRLPRRKESLGPDNAYTSSVILSVATTRSSTLEASEPRTPDELIDYVQAEAALNGRASKLQQISQQEEHQAAPVLDLNFYLLSHDYEPHEITFTSDGLIGSASLRAIVEKMTPHDSTPDFELTSVFWDTWRLFTAPNLLLEEVFRRYEARLPPALLERLAQMSERDKAAWVENKVIPTRIRCFAFLQQWVDTYWRSGDEGVGGSVLERLKEWNRAQEKGLPAMSMRLAEVIRRREQEVENGTAGQDKEARTRVVSRPASRASGKGHARSQSRGESMSMRGLKRSSSVDKLRAASISGQGGLGPTATPALPPTPIITKSLHTLLHKGQSDGGRKRDKLAPINIALAQAYAAPANAGNANANANANGTSGSATEVSSPVTVTLPTPQQSNFPGLPLPPTPTIPLTEFDPLELARQLTLLEQKTFMALDPVDILLCRASNKKVKKAVEAAGGEWGADLAENGNAGLRVLSTLSGQVTGFVVDGILGEVETKKRAGLLKFWIKVAERCHVLNNFSSLFAILAGLNSSTIHRLRKTWDALSAKHRATLDRLDGIIEHSRNHAVYRAALRDAMLGSGGVLPYLGLILTDITFTCDGNPDYRPASHRPEVQLINVDKYAKLARIAADYRRFHEPYNLHEIDAVQNYLVRALAERGSGSVEAMYRKSLQLEPRKNSEKIAGTSVDRPGWLGGRV